VIAGEIVVDNTSDKAYYLGPISAKQAFKGSLPRAYVVFVVHNTNANLKNDNAAHDITVCPEYESIT
jgi:hypothetical protein